MRFQEFSFGLIRIDSITYEHDVVIDQAEIHKRKKKPSKKFLGEFGDTPLSVEEEIPWKCRRLVIGTAAYGSLPVMKDVKLEAERRKIGLLSFDRPDDSIIAPSVRSETADVKRATRSRPVAFLLDMGSDYHPNRNVR